MRQPYSVYTPEALSGLWNKMFMCWLNPLMWRGIAGKPLSLPDLWPCENEFSSQNLSARLDVLWEKHLRHGSRINIFFPLAWEFKWLFLLPTPTRFAQAAFDFSQPFLIQRTLDWYGGPETQDSEDVGHGLIGAYAIIYLGLAVGLTATVNVALSNKSSLRPRLVNTKLYDSPRPFEGVWFFSSFEKPLS